MTVWVLLQLLVGVSVLVMAAWGASALAQRARVPVRPTLWRAALAVFWLVPIGLVVTHALHVRSSTLAVTVPREWAAPLERPLPPLGLVPVAEFAELAAAPGAPRARVVHRPDLSLRLVGGGALLWCGGALLALGLLLRDALAVRRLTRSADPLEDAGVRERLGHWARILQVRRPPRLLASREVPGPMVAGWLRPALLLPAGGMAPGADTDALLVHELAHLRRRDPLIQLVARVTQALWWWHPLAWLTVQQLLASAEEACDDWVIALTGDARAYAQTVVLWAQATRGSTQLACSRCGGRLTERVRRVLEWRPRLSPRGTRRLAAGLGLCTALLVAGLVLVRIHAGTPASAGPLTFPVDADMQVVAAARAGDDARLAALLSGGASPDGHLKTGDTVLQAAIGGCPRDKMAAVARLLIDHGAKVDAQNSYGETALFSAAWVGGPELVRLLLRSGADVMHRSLGGSTPLHKAAQCAAHDAAAVLLEAGAQAEARDRGGETPLHEAAFQQYPRSGMVKLLVGHGAHVDCRDNYGATPLYQAARADNLVMASDLLDRGADVNAATDSGETPLMAAAMTRMPDADARKELIHLLVCRGARMTVPAAVALGDAPALEGLLARGQRTDWQEWLSGQTLLHVAAAAGHSAIVDILVDRGFDPNVRDGQGLTPLHLAAMGTSAETIARLVARGALTDVPDNRGWTPLDAACGMGQVEAVRALLHLGAPWTLPAAALVGDVGHTRALLKQGADPNRAGVGMGAPLFIAAYTGHADVAEALIAGGAKVNARGNWEATPLYFAAAGNRIKFPCLGSEDSRVEVARVLLDNGADVSARAARGWTPLHACAHWQPKMTALLLKYGADRDAKDDEGETPSL
jgi:ankyrin repeat protein